MSEFLLDVDVVFDEEQAPVGDADRPTLEIPEETLMALVAKSTPPVALVGGEPIIRLSLPYRERVSSASAFSLSRRWAQG